jgi:hypothetical protein
MSSPTAPRRRRSCCAKATATAGPKADAAQPEQRPRDLATAASSLGEVLGLGAVGEDELYTALDWLLARQPAIETALAKRCLDGGTLVLYDVSSSYLEGHRCTLARRGYNRDGKKGKLQIVYGLLCAADGCRWRSRAIPPIRPPSPARSAS